MPMGVVRPSPCLLLVCFLAEVQALNLLEWNPHWECFTSERRICQEHAERKLNEVLAERYVDFANVIELEDVSYHVPAGWLASSQRCGEDMTTLIHNSEKWSLSTRVGAVERGCMDFSDRAFLVQQFDENPVYGDRKIVVVGAHYPHGLSGVALRVALSSVVQATGVKSVVLMADTNAGRSVSSEKIMTDIYPPAAGHLRGTALEASCCYNGNFDPELTFDRILTNFGPQPVTELLLANLPPWAAVGELHKPVLAVGPTVTSTSTTRTTTSTTITVTSTSTTTTTTTTTLAPPPVTAWIVAAVAVVSGFAAWFVCSIRGHKVPGSMPRCRDLGRELSRDEYSGELRHTEALCPNREE